MLAAVTAVAAAVTEAVAASMAAVVVSTAVAAGCVEAEEAAASAARPAATSVALAAAAGRRECMAADGLAEALVAITVGIVHHTTVEAADTIMVDDIVMEVGSTMADPTSTMDITAMATTAAAVGCIGRP